MLKLILYIFLFQITKCFDLQNEYMNIDFVDQDQNNYGHQEENQDGELASHSQHVHKTDRLYSKSSYSKEKDDSIKSSFNDKLDNEDVSNISNRDSVLPPFHDKSSSSAALKDKITLTSSLYEDKSENDEKENLSMSSLQDNSEQDKSETYEYYSNNPFKM